MLVPLMSDALFDVPADAERERRKPSVLNANSHTEGNASDA